MKRGHQKDSSPRTLKVKFSLIFVLLALSLLFAIVYNSIQEVQKTASLISSTAGMPILTRVSAIIDGDKHEQLVRTLDETDPYFIETQKIFRELKEETQCKYIYTMARIKNDAGDDVYCYIFDGEDPASEDYSHIGIIEDATDFGEHLIMAYETASARFTPMIERTNWGHLISGYMPIFNTNGDVTGIIGVDFDGEEVYRTIMSNMRIQVGLALIFIIAALCLFLHFFRDIERIYLTSKQKTEAALSEAQAANRAKSTFLATMSHEIRTPLNAILGLAQIQMQQDDLPDKYSDVFAKIHNSGNSLLGIINDILDLTKIETGKLELIPVSYNVADFINDTVQLNFVRIGSKPIECILEADGNLPSTLIGDDLRLKQVLNNLLSNAVKYTESGHIKLTVRTEEIGEDKIRLIFAVEDTGQGIKPEDMKKLFTEYTRFNMEVNRSTEGTGLGLAITKQLLVMMGGDISVESDYGKGSVFTVSVVQKVEDRTPIGFETAQRLCSFSYDDGRSDECRKITYTPMPFGSVLIVDDINSNLGVAKGMLLPYNLRIETAHNGFEAVEKIESGEIYDIIFMDHMMPRMDGIETTQKLRKLGYKECVVALTANALAGSEKMFLENGFDGFISKPIDVMQLDEVLKKFISDRYAEK